jgi:hypothetical protein
LNRDPETRIGKVNKQAIKKHPFFNGIDWDLLYERKIKPPIDLIQIKQELDQSIALDVISIITKYN